MFTFQHFFKGYGIYINFDNFNFKVDGCIDIAKRKLKYSQESITKMLLFFNYWS